MMVWTAEKKRAYHQARRAANPEKYREYKKLYYQQNKKRISAAQKTYRQENKGEINARARACYRADPGVALTKRLQKYGITRFQFDRMWVEQGSCCALCKKPPVAKDGWWAWCVDHCHKTQRVRGILCSGCNKGLGSFGDSPERLEAAAAYLRAATDLKCARQAASARSGRAAAPNQSSESPKTLTAPKRAEALQQEKKM